MPTLVVSWSGKCTDQQTQENLSEKLAELGDISCRMYRQYYSQEIQSIWYKDAKPRDTVLLPEGYFRNQTLPDGFERVNSDIIAARDVGLYGLEFQLFDPRRYNSLLMMSHIYTVSFVFLRCADKKLNGQIVQVRRVNQDHPLSSIGKLFVTRPEVELRYFLENWICKLLNWVREFYIPRLYYWAGFDSPDDGVYKESASDDMQARNREFERVCQAYTEEVAEYF